jgi:WD40 repeat protein
MMYKTNIIVLVFSNAKNKVVIWDDHEKKNRTEITFNNNSVIKNIRLRKDMLVVVLEDKIFVFNFETLKLIEQVETCPNPLGLCGIASAEKPIQKMIACLHNEKGSLKILNYVVDKSIESLIQAHESDIGALAVNSEGTLIATGSMKGTIIRIFSSEEGQLLQELRRGSGKAVITSINFHPTMNMIACTSNRSSIHLFEIKKSVEKCIETKHVGFTDGDVAKNPDGENKKSK